MTKQEGWLDRTFRKHGEEHYGKEYMDNVPSDVLEESRCMAFQYASDYAYEYGCAAPDGTIIDAFFRFLNLNMLYKACEK